MKNIGIVYALCAYFIWGILPIYWHWLGHVDSVEIVAHRMLWCAVFSIILIVLGKQWRRFVAILKQPKIVLRLAVASLLISVNWGVYIWAVNNGQIVETSMGYFMNPLIYVALGVVMFKESLRKAQWGAIALAFVGVAYLVFVHSKLPVVALILAVTFGLYGATKKSLNIPAAQGMAVETALLFLPALGYLMYLSNNQNLQFGQSSATDLLLVGAGLASLTPLLFFAAAAKRISLSALGMAQYLGPTLQLLIGVFIFGESFGSERQVAFGFIWFGLIVFTIDQWISSRARRAMTPV